MSLAHASSPAAATSSPAAPIRDTSLDIDVLRALLRLARRQSPPTMDALVERVGADAGAVRRSLVALARNGLVQRTPAGLRLSLPGLAVAVAYAKRPKPAKPAKIAKVAKLPTKTAKAKPEIRRSAAA